MVKNEIKKLALIALVSDDTLFNTLVLKGGNALDLIYEIGHRSSFDLDFSIENEIDESHLEAFKNRIKKLLEVTFAAANYAIIDYRFMEVPPKRSEDMKTFWGGYKIEFKVVNEFIAAQYSNDIETLRKNAKVTDDEQRKKFYIEISKFEFCKRKQREHIDGYSVYVYTPAMIVFEKLRAICQQMKEYKQVVNNPSISARAKDFFDIYILIEKYKIDLGDINNQNILKEIFNIKKVPLEFIGLISNYREYHRLSFKIVEETVPPKIKLESFDFYFDYVIDESKKLEPLWVK